MDQEFSEYSEPMTSHAPPSASSRRSLLHRTPATYAAAGGRRGRHVESLSLTSTKNPTCHWMPNCLFTCRTILPNFISIRFETNEFEPWAFLRSVRRLPAISPSACVVIGSLYPLQLLIRLRRSTFVLIVVIYAAWLSTSFSLLCAN